MSVGRLKIQCWKIQWRVYDAFTHAPRLASHVMLSVDAEEFELATEEAWATLAC